MARLAAVSFVHQHQPLTRLKPGEAFPVCVAKVFGKELSQIERLSDWLARQVKPLQPMVKILWPLHGIFRSDENQKNPIIDRTNRRPRPDEVRCTEALRFGFFTCRFRDFQFNCEPGIPHL